MSSATGLEPGPLNPELDVPSNHEATAPPTIVIKINNKMKYNPF